MSHTIPDGKGNEGGREGKREGGRERGREGGRDGGREGGRGIENDRLCKGRWPEDE